MILKIRRFTITDQWFIIGDIRSIDVSESYYKGVNYAFMDYDKIIDDVKSECGCSGEPDKGVCSKCKRYILCTCKLNDGSDYYISFDTMAYLLNNEGKTIEKIVVGNDPQ